MPITRRQFELGIDDKVEELMQRIASYLEDHKDSAFSFEELKLALHTGPERGELGAIYASPRPEWHLLGPALERLVDLNVVSLRVVAGTGYYATGRYSLEDILSGKEDPYKRAS